jgi:hypothetical protein
MAHDEGMTQPEVLSWPGLLVIVLGSSLLGTLLAKLLDHSSARAADIRSTYANAIKALNSWGQFPNRIRRRVDDAPETLRTLEDLGAKNQELLAYSIGWVNGENPAVGRVLNELVVLLRAEVAIHARVAWASPPADSAAQMNLGGPVTAHEGLGEYSGRVPAEWVVVQLFSQVIRYRFGWRRLLPTWYLQRRFDRMRIIHSAREAFETRSFRRLYASEASERAERR